MKLEFAPNAPRGSRIGTALLVAAVLAFGASAFEIARVLATTARQTELLAALDARRGAAATADVSKRPAAVDPADLARNRAVRLVAQNLVTPWAGLLESLESAPNRSVALLSVEPSVAKHSIRLTAEARTSQDMLDYLASLQRDQRLNSAVLVSHQVQAQAPGTPVRFQVQASWVDAP